MQVRAGISRRHLRHSDEPRSQPVVASTTPLAMFSSVILVVSALATASTAKYHPPPHHYSPPPPHTSKSHGPTPSSTRSHSSSRSTTSSKTIISPISLSSTTSICTTTLCADYINSCGQPYGGCYPACSGYTTPSFTDPGCPTITSSSSTLSSTSVCLLSLCDQSINSCGRAYGGCYPACSGYTIPSFTDPGCPSTTTVPPTSSPICTSSICADFINSCGQTYGGCYAACSGFTTPSFTDPGCPTITTSSTLTISTSSTTTDAACHSTACIDYINACGQTYGGCFPYCSGYTIPSFTAPPCTGSTTNTVSTVVATTTV